MCVSCSIQILFSILCMLPNRMNDALELIPSDNDSSDSENEVDTGCCKIFICSRKAPSSEKDSDKVDRRNVTDRRLFSRCCLVVSVQTRIIA